MGDIAKAPFLVVHKTWKTLLEVCHFSQDLNPIWSASEQQKLLVSMADIGLEEAKKIEALDERFEFLRHYFFEELGFHCVPAKELRLPSSFLPEVLQTRSGPTSLLTLLFSALLEEADIEVKFCMDSKHAFLVTCFNGRRHVFDFQNKCQPLSTGDILDLINEGFDFNSETDDRTPLVVAYLNQLEALARKAKTLNIRRLIHSHLMRYQPFNLKHLKERAQVAFETGDYQEALSDIRDYFQYKQPERTSSQLKALYKSALKKTRDESSASPLSHS